MAAAALAFLPALRAGFVADDFRMLQTVGGLGNPLDAFTDNDLGVASGGGHFYRPLWVLLNAAVHAVFGDSAVAFHALNIVLFAAIAALVWMLAMRLFSDRWRAGVATLGFALYPRHGESVAWVSGNTDMLATAFVLGSVLVLVSGRDRRSRVGIAIVLAGAAALSKEIGFATPFLAAGTLYVTRRGSRTFDWREPAAVALALVPVLIVRFAVLGGSGGYGSDPFTPKRGLGAAASYVVGALTPHQLEVLRHPVLLIVPAALAALLAHRLLRLRSPEPGAFAVGVLGLAWFAVAVAPVLNLPLDLNTANGERLLFLPSVGLMLTVAAAAGRPGRREVAGATAASALLLALSLVTAQNWYRAGQIADRSLDGLSAVAVTGQPLVVLSQPEGYRNAHVLLNNIDTALARRGIRPSVTEVCLPVQVRTQSRGAVTFRLAGRGVLEGSTGWDAPFDFPVLGTGRLHDTGCTIERPAGAPREIGLALRGRATPDPLGGRVRVAYFDGYTMRALR